MRGQDEYRLDERDQQNGDYDKRDDAYELAEHAGYEYERGKGRNGREYREGHRHKDLEDAVYRGLRIALAHPPVFEDVLADDYRVVDDYPERHYEGE